MVLPSDLDMPLKALAIVPKKHGAVKLVDLSGSVLVALRELENVDLSVEQESNTERHSFEL